MERRRKTRGKIPEPGGAAHQTAPTAANFSFALSRVAVSQICWSVGFRSAEFSALETLTLIATKYLQSLAGLAASFSNAANRTESSLFDVINSLLDLSSSYHGFPGGSAIHDTDAHCLIRSSVLRDLSGFVGSTPEIPFAKPVPRQNDDGSGKQIRHASEENAPPRMKHVPAWLPPFPDASLYEERFSRQRSDDWWENSDSVRDNSTGGYVPREISKSDCSGGSSCRSGSELPEKRERVRVRFKLERRGERAERRSCACRSDERATWRWDNNAGGADGEPETRKKKKKKKR